MATVHTNKHNRTPLAHRRTLPVSTSAYVSAVDYTGELDLWKSVGPEVMHRWHPGPECTRFEHLSSLLLKPTHLHGYRAHEQAQPPPVDASPQVSVGETLVCIKSGI